MNTDNLVTIEQFAKLVGKNRTQIYLWTQPQQIRCKIIAGKRFIDLDQYPVSKFKKLTNKL